MEGKELADLIRGFADVIEDREQKFASLSLEGRGLVAIKILGETIAEIAQVLKNRNGLRTHRP